MSKKSFALIAFSLLVATESAVAATFVVPKDREMVRRADAIVVASALTSYSQMSELGWIETVTPISIEEVIKGKIDGKSIDLHEPGGVVGDRMTLIPGVPSFTNGQRVLLFLTRTPQGTWAVTDLVLGKFSFESDRVGQKLLIREEGEVVGWDPDGNSHREMRRSASGFLRFIRTEAQGGMGKEDYQVAFHPLRVKSDSFKMTANVFTANSYTFTVVSSSGSRWATFPSSVSFYTGTTTEPGAPGGGVTAVTNAISAWDGDCASNVNYVYAGVDDGTHTAGLASADGRNTVLFERNLAAYGAAAFTCNQSGYSGTLGVGGVTLSTGTHSLGSETFGTTVEGDVEMNQNIANCTLLFNTGDWNSALAHEIGHTLGIRHSNKTRPPSSTTDCTGDPTLDCTATAIMKDFIPTGLNGVLQAWDQRAVRAVYPGPCGIKRADFDLDTKTDVSIFRPIEGSWYIRNSSTGSTSIISNWGQGANDAPVPGDYDADGKTDAAVFRPGSGEWFIKQSSNGSLLYIPNWGLGASDIPVQADYDGDGKTDAAVFRPGSGEWFIKQSSNGSLLYIPNWGLGASDVPVPGDYDGDGKADAAVFRPGSGEWFIRQSSNASLFYVPNFGIGGSDKPVPADYDGDGKTDVAIFRPIQGNWYIRRSTDTGVTFIPSWGLSANDKPVQGDYDGDGKADVAVFRTGTGEWFIRQSTNGAMFYVPNYGPLSNDKPVPQFAH